MPRPPILPTLDWKAIFERGKRYEQWIAQGENGENRKKMEGARWNFSIEPDVEGLLRSLPRPVHVAAIGEDWCGDVVRHVPVLQRMADAAPNLKVRYFSREDAREFFVRFLTNGGEAIPKFIFLSEKFIECGNWGPMPEKCREIIARGKACGGDEAARKKVSALYQADPTCREVVREILHLLDIASAGIP
ncbi:MAG: thioredoxin family protein [bacterium]